METKVLRTKQHLRGSGPVSPHPRRHSRQKSRRPSGRMASCRSAGPRAGAFEALADADVRPPSRAFNFRGRDDRSALAVLDAMEIGGDGPTLSPRRVASWWATLRITPRRGPAPAAVQRPLEGLAEETSASIRGTLNARIRAACRSRAQSSSVRAWIAVSIVSATREYRSPALEGLFSALPPCHARG